MTTLDSATIDKIARRHPDVFRSRPWQRYGSVIGVLAIILYSAYCWWFFDVSRKLDEANWNIAGAYLADWISWEARPDIRIAKDGAMEVRFPRFSPLGADPRPDWLTIEKKDVSRTVEVKAEPKQAALENKIANSFMVPDAQGTQPQATPSPEVFMAPQAPVGNSAAPAAETRTEIVHEEVLTHATVKVRDDIVVDVRPNKVTVNRLGETLTVRINPDGTVAATTPLPDWAEQKYAGGKIMLWFGFAGRAEIDHNSVKVRRRTLGWENFVFDTRSPFWDMSAGQVIGAIVRGDRIEADRTNLSLAWNNILYNEEWQHLDVWTKLLQTIIMAFVGTLFAGVLAFPLAFLAARNITRSTIVNQLNKRLFDFLRSVDMLIWALFFTRAFGPGPLAGISAIFVTDTGTLGKLYSESLENIDDRQREGVRSVGASPAMVQRYGVLPQVLPLFASQMLYFWESNTRSATIIGAVGAGGIGLKLWEAMRTNQDWENVAYMVVLILIVVFVFDTVSNFLRSRLMGTQSS